MDEIKDTQKPKSVSKFFDTTEVGINPFGSNQSGERAYKKAERIVAGLFLASNHIPATEPLRIAIRKETPLMLQLVLGLRDGMRSPESPKQGNLQASLLYLSTLTRMLTVSGFVSSENTGMLLGALNELGTFLGAARASTLSDSLLFSRHEFQDTGAQRIRDIKDRSNLKDKIAMSDTVTNTRTLHVRKGNILEVLRGGRDLGIVDIASNLPEYSAKMIQRDLAELVAEGTVKKTGLKRWSRYMIAS